MHLRVQQAGIVDSGKVATSVDIRTQTMGFFYFDFFTLSFPILGLFEVLEIH